jgi:hypothetical protein
VFDHHRHSSFAFNSHLVLSTAFRVATAFPGALTNDSLVKKVSYILKSQDYSLTPLSSRLPVLAERLVPHPETSLLLISKVSLRRSCSITRIVYIWTRGGTSFGALSKEDCATVCCGFGREGISKLAYSRVMYFRIILKVPCGETTI